MASKIRLVRYASLPGLGWRRGSIPTNKKGELKADTMLYNGVEYPCPNGVYQARTSISGKAVYTPLGNDLTEALKTVDKANDSAQIKVLEERLGIKQEKPTEKTIEEWKKSFLRKFAVGSTDRIYLYTTVADQFCDLLKNRHKEFPSQIEEDDIISIDRKWEANGYAKWTRSTRYTAVRTFLKHVGIDPQKLIDKQTNQKLKSKPQTLPEIYTEKEIATLIAVSSDYHALCWEALYKLGFRDEELCTLEWENIDLENGTAEIRFKPHVKVPGSKTEGWKPKDSEERLVPIPPSLLEKLKAWHEKHKNTQFVFGTRSDTVNIKLLKALKSDWRRADLNCKKCRTCKEHDECEKAYLHKFRASYLTKMFSHCNPRDVMRLAGHSSLETTLRYLRPAAMDGLQKAVVAAFD